MDQTQPVTPWYRNPFWLGAVGVVLVVCGYMLSTYLPEPSSPAARMIAELEQMRGGEHADLGERLREMRPPPFRWAGRLLMLVGLVLFVSATVMMSRTPARAPAVPDDETPMKTSPPA